jgi:recombination endonuclease VII
MCCPRVARNNRRRDDKELTLTMSDSIPQKAPMACKVCGETDLDLLMTLRFRGTEIRKERICKSCHLMRLRLRQYHLSMEQYQAMEDRQSNLCAICGKPPKGRVLHIDHCHRSGKVRALLCGSCNMILGLANDDQEILMNALAYLREHSAM